MSTLLVSDTSVLVDLDRGDLLEALFRLPFSIGVPDVLFVSELAKWRGEALVSFGLTVLELDSTGVGIAQDYAARSGRISVPDAFALALAKTGGYTLLTGDGRLRALADQEHVPCHGLLWVLDQLESGTLVGPERLLEALKRISASHRVRLPADEVVIRLERYRRLAS